MKSFKLRAWDEKNKIMGFLDHPFDENWYTIESVYGNAPAQVAFPNKWAGKESPDNIEIMRATGLSDKNDTEIYEQDIVKIPTTDDDYIFGLIEWNGKYGRFEVAEYEPYSDDCFQKEAFDDWTGIEHFEVIGNAYMNLELFGK